MIARFNWISARTYSIEPRSYSTRPRTIELECALIQFVLDFIELVEVLYKVSY